MACKTLQYYIPDILFNIILQRFTCHIILQCSTCHRTINIFIESIKNLRTIIIFIESIFFIEYKYRVYDIATFYMP